MTRPRTRSASSTGSSIKGQAKKRPRGLTVDERQALLDWFDQTRTTSESGASSGSRGAAELPELVRFSLGTGLRIGEALAVRRLDVRAAQTARRRDLRGGAGHGNGAG